MFTLTTAFSRATSLAALTADLQPGSAQVASLTLLFGTADSLRMLAEANTLLPSSEHWIGGTSCLGVMTQQQTALDGPSVGLLRIYDETGRYAVKSAALQQGDIQAQAADLLQQAMAAAGRPGTAPALIWCVQAPGDEEDVLLGIRTVVGGHVPVYGGSAADDDLSGAWLQFDGQRLLGQGLVLAVLYPSITLAGYFSAGYSLTPQRGTVTAAAGREILQIDHQPAAEVYQRWALQPQELVVGRQALLPASALRPLGRIINQIENIPLMLLSLPVYQQDGRLGLLSQVRVGEQLWLLEGCPDQLRQRAAQVVAVALEVLTEQGIEPAGAMIVLCAGSMLVMRNSMASVQAGIQAVLPGLPFLVGFTYGEQGSFVDGTNRHGNLMMSAIVFGKTNAPTLN